MHQTLGISSEHVVRQAPSHTIILYEGPHRLVTMISYHDNMRAVEKYPPSILCPPK